MKESCPVCEEAGVGCPHLTDTPKPQRWTLFRATGEPPPDDDVVCAVGPIIPHGKEVEVVPVAEADRLEELANTLTAEADALREKLAALLDGVELIETEIRDHGPKNAQYCQSVASVFDLAARLRGEEKKR